MNQKSEQSNKGVITFYELLGEDVSHISAQDAWKRIINSNPRGSSCRDIFSFDMNMADLQSQFDDLTNFPNDLLDDIRNLHENDFANFMFINPQRDATIEGYYIKDFLSQFEQ